MSPGLGPIIGFAGLVVATLIGAALERALLKPISDLRDIQTRIDKELSTYAHVIANPGSPSKSKIDDAQMAFRSSASELAAKADAVPLYAVWSTIGIIPSKESIGEANDELIKLSNKLHKGNPVENDTTRKNIRDLLEK